MEYRRQISKLREEKQFSEKKNNEWRIGNAEKES
jgi:hypothetical protein